MRNLTMMTDLYELTMMNGYLRFGMEKNRACFDIFYRKQGDMTAYAVAAGLEQAIDYVKNLHFSADDIAYLRSLKIFDDAFLEKLSTLRFTGEILAVPEGTVIFPGEPIVRVIAPIMEAQLLETALLNIINHQTLIATKASRVVQAARGDGVLEFGLRRAQGPDAGIYGARAAMTGGCQATSNVLTGQLFGVPVGGTHAHSWVMSFPDELSAFRAYAEVFPKNCLLLVDTYDTLASGVPNAITVFGELRAKGYEPMGIRLDSGDLAYLSKKVRKMLDDAGFTDAIISASNDLDEYLIQSLKSQGATITSWGVGTNLITSKDCPAFGGVYKLAAIADDQGGFIPKIKLSENTEKVTNPGNKTFFRIYDKESGKIKADLICLHDETFDTDQDMKLFDPNEPWKKTTLPGGSYTMKEMLVPVICQGKRVYDTPPVMEIQKICNQEKETLWEENKRFTNPSKIHVDLSQKLYDMKQSLLSEMSR
mgnify:CR=1 FL=1